jgi:iron transport multicopper oxidase
MIRGLKDLLGSLTLLATATITTLNGVNAVDYTFNIGNAVLAPDGFNRSTVVVNGQFPGPLISATKGEPLNVRYIPRLLSCLL